MAKVRKLPSVNYLQELFTYDKDTGDLCRIKNTPGNRGKAGNIAGTKNNKGYIILTIKGTRYKAHRIAWKMHHNQDPADCLDHINRNKSDNRIINLREVGGNANCLNRSLSTRNKSGCIGVSWHKTNKRWQAYIRIYGKYKHLGVFKNKQDAITARKKAEECFWKNS